ncbi:flagellar basal body P-ring protein FlgI [Parerythrobacter jejuensis]|uniref:Flagellar P-ring protein n=1 Tax=Parerythrobacter jejuensis TaxID=795812 RepID=A0A845AK11_9SPHN|nr:flagellar basal body P-ring protein FlgI [Parerythrobacter jejuensis]MXP30600.1 flagellar basal body P-ring protein FlgI [Parerythrobacter jejuensis]MXP33360.1 flagellar basal body P-ring protein FlgI [Parerythrobacter jejuensis]
MHKILFLILAAFALALPGTAQAERIRDLGSFQGLRANQLTGYGVVVGLQGTGDDNLEYLTEAMRGISGRLGMPLPPGVSPGLKNAAAVIVTAELPPFAKPGQRIDITVSTLGKAKSLRGGALILTPLMGADGQVYAMAQGNVAVGGLGVSGRDGSQLTVNVPTVGRIADGASVERAVATGFNREGRLRYNLHQADFLTASRVRDAVNRRFPGAASIVDGVTLEFVLPLGNNDRSAMMAQIEMIAVTPAPQAARVIVNSRTGTVVINQAVRLQPAAISHGKLTIRIDEAPRVVQPAPFSEGVTAVEESSTLSLEEQTSNVIAMPGAASLSEIVDALNLLGVGASDLVVILEALKQAGALQAEMVVL